MTVPRPYTGGLPLKSCLDFGAHNPVREEVARKHRQRQYEVLEPTLEILPYLKTAADPSRTAPSAQRCNQHRRATPDIEGLHRRSAQTRDATHVAGSAAGICRYRLEDPEAALYLHGRLRDG